MLVVGVNARRVRGGSACSYTPSMPVTFEQPLWLLLALLAIPAGVVGLAWFTAMSRARAWSAVIARSVLLILLAMMLAGASAVRTSDRLAVIAVVDVSESVRQFAEFEESGSGQPIAPAVVLRQWIERAASAGARGPDDLLGVVVFDGAAAAAMLPRPAKASSPRDAASAGGPTDFSLDERFADGTNIDRALRFAAALFPPDAARRLVLISDGNETEGDALDAARRLASTGAGRAGGAIPVDVLPLSYRVHHEVMVEAVDAPPQAAPGSTVAVRVVLTATEEAEGALELLYDGEALDLNGSAPGTARRVSLRPGPNVETLEIRLARDRTVHRFRPVFIPDNPAGDRVAVNNSAEAFTITPGQGAVLVVDGVGSAAADSPGRNLANALARAGLDVRVVPPTDVQPDLLWLQAHDLIILQNVAADEVPRPTQRLLADYVSDLGGGLVMVGGPDSFGAGGWNGTPIETILPVDLDLPEQLLVPSAAVVLVIDNSGSMGNRVGGTLRTQQEIANEGAALAVETLDRTDMVCVIAFSSDYSVLVPMQRNSEPARAASKVRSIAPGGGTNLYPALLRAHRELSSGEAATAGVRHVIVLSDGVSQPPTVDDTFENLAARMRDEGITVTTICVGDGADAATMARIAHAGGGQFYEVVDPNLLPRVFLKEIRVVRKPLIREAPFVPVDVGSGSALIAGVPRPIPPLRGLVLTQKRADPRATTVFTTTEGEPVLASWYVGRGRVAAFTSDAHWWARDWLRWPGYATIWTQIARQTARPASDRSGVLTTEAIGDELLLRYEAADPQGRPMDLLTVAGVVYGPGGRREEVRLGQVGPGEYEARVPAASRGNYYVVLLPRRGEHALPSVVGGVSRAVGAELRVSRSNVALLRQIAEATGGRLLDVARPEAADLFNRDGVRPTRAAMPIWPVLMAWTIAFFLLDVGTRRIAWDRLLTRELAREIREQAATLVRARSERAAATVAALRTKHRRHAADEARPADAAATSPPILAPTGSQLRAQMRGGATADDADHPAIPSKDEGAEPGSTTSGLLAAKRRAAKRYENDADQ